MVEICPLGREKVRRARSWPHETRLAGLFDLLDEATHDPIAVGECLFKNAKQRRQVIMVYEDFAEGDIVAESPKMRQKLQSLCARRTR